MDAGKASVCSLRQQMSNAQLVEARRTAMRQQKRVYFTEGAFMQLLQKLVMAITCLGISCNRPNKYSDAQREAW